ncbi:lysine N(6)-hydroxylase/L-ornithine N(5)-oxygenase family protein [Kocuria sp.]|uniref:lysine N(6)-hydroxylase/L-ornithine N(5)-oxygenase family protein n=1 Tax=Kocuria sp. TaxID=1871328 RepID=UPI0026DFDD3D|nr:SidA/IucD/PvdA family monooxygenase [Kocuria sp.]MDO5618420.1 SidA/IucD/PvdA family monooxygenase [Kocuria sp.]
MYDVVGIGFGPANLALAIAIDDYNRTVSPQERVKALFLERREVFSWHPGMMLPGVTMQISFLKDLVSFRDVTHPLSFLAYAQGRGRLEHFVNKQTFFPSREEFSDYLSWAAEAVADQVWYGAEVISVTVEPTEGAAVIKLASGEELHTRAVVHAPGLQPRLPEGIERSARLVHTHEILDVAAHRLLSPRQVVVIGAGQSAAEVVEYLHAQDDETTVHAVFSKVGYTPADDSPFANRIFDPEMVDRWHAAPQGVRDRMFAYHRGTNYSAVDPELIESLYNREYEERVTGRRRLFMHNCTEMLECVEDDDGVTVTVRDLMTGELSTLRADLVVFGSGYRQADPIELFGNDAQWYRHDGVRPEVLRDYRWSPKQDGAPDVFLNGGVEHSHGLTSSLLSNLAVRSGEILERLIELQAANLPNDSVREHSAADEEAGAETGVISEQAGKRFAPTR